MLSHHKDKYNYGKRGQGDVRVAYVFAIIRSEHGSVGFLQASYQRQYNQCEKTRPSDKNWNRTCLQEAEERKIL